MALPELLMPADLPPWRADPHVIRPGQIYGRVARQAGASRKRRVFRSAPSTLEAELEVTQSQLESFYAWHEGPLEAGAKPFTAKVAKIGPGFEYWEAYILSFTAEHQQGSHHRITAELRLRGSPSDILPDPGSLGASFSAALELTIEPSYAWALSAEIAASLEMEVATGASLSAELKADLQTEFSGALPGVTLDSEYGASLEIFVATLASEELASEYSAGFELSLAPEVALSSEYSVALEASVADSVGYVASPADFTVFAYSAAYPGGFARATVQTRPNGTIYKRVNTGGYTYQLNWYSPTTAGAGTGHYVRAVAVSGSAPTSGSLGLALDAGSNQDWYLERSSVGTDSGVIQIQFATDPDFLSIVSSFDVDLSVEYAT